jgi:hypothetical protein
MSSPTVGPEPNFTQGGAPEGQAGWSAAPPPPQPGYGPAPTYGSVPAGHGAVQRPTQVSTAAILGIVSGGLGILGGLLLLFALSLIFALGAFGAIYGIFVLLSLAVSVALLVGGIQALQGKSPKLLLYLSYASVAIGLLSLILSVSSGYGFSFWGLLGFIIPGAIIALLWQPVSKQYYAARGVTY